MEHTEHPKEKFCHIRMHPKKLIKKLMADNNSILEKNKVNLHNVAKNDVIII